MPDVRGIYVCGYLYEKCRIKRAFRVAASLYFGFFPVIVMFALCSAKDGIFTGAMLLLLIALYEMGKEKEKFLPDGRNRCSYLPALL